MSEAEISAKPDASVVQLTRKDFQTKNDVRWCPGCGDYAILATMQRTLPELGVAKENIVFVSGIGCAARFPYYMETYGMHTVHGRAPTIATGLKVARPELDVWVITGDGDSLSIGGNHTLHMLRRNVKLKVLLFNNKVYGLTKGQYSPSSDQGMVTKSTPTGSLDFPVNPLQFAIGSGATFVARTIDREAKHLAEVLKAAHEHQGTAYVEILQNCIVFNDGVFAHVSEGKERKLHQLFLEHGKPLVYADGTRGIGFSRERMSPFIIDLEKEPARQGEVLIHDEADETGMMAIVYAKMDHPEFPVPLGVFRKQQRPAYDDLVAEQGQRALAKHGKGTLKDLLYAGDMWTVEG
jgi:2-oxoglutarate/2-oxoacid ferredoxin oxidoreductase subunit beta